MRHRNDEHRLRGGACGVPVMGRGSPQCGGTHQRGDNPHLDPAICGLALLRIDQQFSLAIALDDHVFGRDVEVFGQGKRH